MKLPQAAALVAALLIPGFASAGHDEAELALTSARANVAAAERADAGRHATLELKAARDTLAQAEGSFEDRDWTDAEREAERARADARLAEARARQRTSEAVAAELESAIRTLREEIARKGV